MNPLLEKVIKAVRLKGKTGFVGPSEFVNDYGPIIAENGIILKATSVVKARNIGRFLDLTSVIRAVGLSVCFRRSQPGSGRLGQIPSNRLNICAEIMQE